MRTIEERVVDYAGLGVQSTWVVDPWRRMAYRAAGIDGVLHEARELLTVEGTRIEVRVDELVAELDRREARSRRV